MRNIDALAGFATAALLAAAAAGGMARPAQAAVSCPGRLSANLINPMPRPADISVHISDASVGNAALAQRFKAGLAAGGATLADAGAMSMEFATSIVGLPEGATGSGAVSPEFGFVGRLPMGADSPVLTMSISLMDRKAAEISWVGYITCKVHDPDLSQVAQELGYAIGRAIGQTFPPRPL